MSSMIILYKPTWRKNEDLKNTNETWMQVFTNILTILSFPNFVFADVERAKRHEEYTYWPDEEENIESSRTEQPEWMDLLSQVPILTSTSAKILFMMMEDVIVNGVQKFSLSKGQRYQAHKRSQNFQTNVSFY